LVSTSVTRIERQSLMPVFFATHCAVAGMSCISPLAPARDFASAMKRLS
jgi:hypothetical protein